MSREEYQLLLEAIKANTKCKEQRKEFNLAVANPISKYIQPQLVKREAAELVNCFSAMLKGESEEQRGRKELAIDSLMRGEDAVKLVSDYVLS